MQSFTFLNNLVQKIIPFFKKYGLFIAPVFLFMFFILLIIFSITQSSSQKSAPTAAPSQTDSQTDGGVQNNTTNGSQENQVSNDHATFTNRDAGLQSDEYTMGMWTGKSFDTSDLDGLNASQTTLPDGSTQYSYASDIPNEQNTIIVKNDVNIFETTPISDTTISDATSFYGNPEYIAYGSHAWGQGIQTYIYISQGVAFVIDPKQNQTLEEIVFEPGSLDLFEQYDTDMIGQPQKPQL